LVRKYFKCIYLAEGPQVSMFSILAFLYE